MIQFPGVQVAHYTIVRKAPGGDGGMGAVFVASDSRTSGMVALKLVPVGDDREAQEVVAAEQDGARFQQQLWEKFRQVPEIYEFGTDGGYFYIAMEFLEGENLSATLTAGALPADRAIRIAIQVCHFLEAAHSLGPMVDGTARRSLVHGDLKPRNIRILDNDDVRVFDFGIAKALSFSRKVTRNDFGSLAYLSPERIQTGEIDEQADLWALGVILYEMLSGAQPFQDRNTRLLELRICSRRPPEPLDERSPIGLRAITAKLLAGAAELRYMDAAAVRADLERARDGQVTDAERDGWPARALEEPATARVRTPGPVPDEATRRTTPPAPAQGSAIPAAPPTRWERLQRAPTTLTRFGTSLLQLMVLVMVLNETRVMWSASRLTEQVPGLELSAIDDAWQRHDSLASPSLHLGSMRLERALVRQSKLLAETVFADYRSPSPTVREAQWKQVRDMLYRASVAQPGDRELRASLAYAEGQLHRIDGEARKARRQNADAQRELSAAVTSFQKAADLRSDWPDPLIGLMRTYVYGLDDVDRGEETLKGAEKRGYLRADRDLALLADGHRSRAESLVRAARAVSGMSQEPQYFSQAANEYRQALDLYASIPAFGDSVKNMRAIQRALSAVEDHVDALPDTELASPAPPRSPESPLSPASPRPGTP